jgi:hypothetical protein
MPPSASPPSSPRRPTLTEIRASVKRQAAQYSTRASAQQTREEDNQRYARSVLEMCRMDSEEQVLTDPSHNYNHTHKPHHHHHHHHHAPPPPKNPEPPPPTGDLNAESEVTPPLSPGRTLTDIQDLRKALPKHPTPLSLALLIARKYVSLNMDSSAIPFFQMSCKIVPYVPIPMLPVDVVAEKRKLERMGGPQKERYLAAKAEQEKEDERAFLEEQRVRVMSSHYEIGRAHLEIKEAENATENLRVWMGMSTEGEEREGIWREIDRLVSGYHDLSDLAVGEWTDKSYSAATM